jgi:hypothetical protein
MIYLSEFKIINPVIPTSPLRKLELPIKCQLYARSLSTAFSDSLSFASFFSEVNPTFTNFSKTHHKLRSSRTTSSHLGEFTSKSNKCFTSCLTWSKVHKA